MLDYINSSKHLARTSATVDALPLGKNWFRSVIQVRRTGALIDRATIKHLKSSFRVGQCIKTHFQEVPKACHASAKHRRPHCKRDLLSHFSALRHLQDPVAVVVVVDYPTPFEGLRDGGKPWRPRSRATPQGLDQRS